MENYNGSKTKIVNSSYLFTTLQTLYTKIKKLIEGKSDKNHNHDSLIFNTDARNETTIPNDYDGKFKLVGIKSCNKIGLDNGQTYAFVIGYRGWYDFTAGHAFELAFSGSNIYQRYGSTTEWSDWKILGGENATNADTVDGYHASDLLRSDGGNLNGIIYGSTGGQFTFDGNVFLNTGGYSDWISNILNDRIPTNASCNKNWNWNGLGGQPTWMWGGEDGTNMYVYNPRNFYVNASDKLQSTGFGSTEFTYYQTSESFDGNTGWCHYLIANHGNGEDYYHYSIGLPFWDTPIYKRQYGGINDNSGWHKFHTDETITKGTGGMTAGVSNLQNNHIYIQYE